MVDKIQSINSNLHINPLKKIEKNNVQETSFSDLLKQSLEAVNKAQNKSDQLTNDFVSGKPIELHNVMIAAEKASILLQTTVEVRNKAVEAYQEIMRMQV